MFIITCASLDLAHRWWQTWCVSRTVFHQSVRSCKQTDSRFTSMLTWMISYVQFKERNYNVLQLSMEWIILNKTNIESMGTESAQSKWFRKSWKKYLICSRIKGSAWGIKQHFSSFTHTNTHTFWHPQTFLESVLSSWESCSRCTTCSPPSPLDNTVPMYNLTGRKGWAGKQ